jgi:hypothetical protein
MGRKTVKAGLDRMEREIEDSAGQFRPASSEKREKVEAILDSARKSRNSNSNSRFEINGKMTNDG